MSCAGEVGAKGILCSASGTLQGGSNPIGKEVSEERKMILETSRLILRPLTIADAETAYRGWTGDTEVAKYVSWLPHHSISDTMAWLKEIEWKQNDAGGPGSNDNYIWGFVLKETGELFGSGGLIWEDRYRLFQIGYNIKRSHWNRGYTTEAMRAVLSFAATVLGIRRVAGGHAKENPASAKVIEKLGFVYDKDDITYHVDGIRYFDSREYFLDLDEYVVYTKEC
jgi:ribosomal-protein-alanine N-acetyltransferase